MPKSKQKTAIDLPEFSQEDIPVVKRSRKKAKPAVAPPVAIQPETAQPEVAKPEIAETTMAKPAITQSIITPPEIVKPEILEPLLAQPAIAQLEAVKPKIANSSIFQPTIMPEKSEKSSGNIWKKIIVGVVLAILVLLSATTFYFYRQWRQTKTNPQEVAQDALSEIVAEVGKLIELPTGETPTMATVTSVEKLKDQPFFAKAQNGDKALIYSQAGKAILYRPASHKIIEVISLVGNGQLSDNPLPPAPQPPAATSEAAPAPTETPAVAETPAETPTETPAEIPEVIKVAIYNGTTQKGLAGNLAAKISGISEIKVVKTGNAKGNFAKTIVIDLSGNNQALSQKIIETIGGEIGAMPENETRPDADILIIGGSDFEI